MLWGKLAPVRLCKCRYHVCALQVLPAPLAFLERADVPCHASLVSWISGTASTCRVAFAY